MPRATRLCIRGTEEEVLENIREAIELYLEPNPIELESGALIREVLAG